MSAPTAAIKTCRVCREGKPLEEFHRNSQAKDGRQSQCKPCAVVTRRQWYQDQSPERRRAVKVVMHGITPERYADLFNAQGGVCAICRQPESIVDYRSGLPQHLSIDHDHRCCPGKTSCGRCVRGLLCSLCNHGLGKFQDDIERLRGAIEYLRASGQDKE